MKHSAAAFQAARPADTPVDAEGLPHACRTWRLIAAQRSGLDADLRGPCFALPAVILLQTCRRAEIASDDLIGCALYDRSEGCSSSMQKSIGAFWNRSANRPLVTDDRLGFDRVSSAASPSTPCHLRSHNARFSLPQGGVPPAAMCTNPAYRQEGYGLLALPFLYFAIPTTFQWECPKAALYRSDGLGRADRLAPSRGLPWRQSDRLKDLKP